MWARRGPNIPPGFISASVAGEIYLGNQARVSPRLTKQHSAAASLKCHLSELYDHGKLLTPSMGSPFLDRIPKVHAACHRVNQTRRPDCCFAAHCFDIKELLILMS